MRIGHGYDVHAFTEGDHLVLGGVKIPHTHAFKAHSDGDVLLHAICDALLGALALGDIGQHFPDTAAEYANIDSRILLRHVYGLVTSRGYAILNLDSTIIAQSPKMMPHIPAMRTNIAADLACAIGQINVKATTTEKLGFTGRKEGIAAHAVVLLGENK
ncbi:MAG TPA: 2-C-methyl-D-erythritol 2,4-cyclodiphosphate synthase [Candidatus Thiothrix moscowensis]|uniref:2-C-methyl-D-erythritol 2,4-cyclodiphosphate synthase n=1 Tax=unclassified Thiothrix TaxID=2636184 RepID=UPI0025F3F2DB|nr:MULTISPECIES: 2-C-methyl-D-erythritol 2,4-cyclodiphosphate synthase [unclassified Thiothrix]HRJ53762.1 2-C-methyl-D-erythritol 2,4-cyclodiphosphate synthase [Candidatus Thiothrix moscowensis]HRJ93844.1 2-C-methyl-D-erythritol 2,4-cyclodiphosphate synthase [Candidatus Thiothrix moscowensis]